MRTTTLQSPADWAQQEFGFAELGDPRRNKRLVKIGTELAAKPGGTLPQAFLDWPELKAAYRFFGNPVVDFQNVLRPHLERTRQRCQEPGEYLIIEDSTELDFSRHRKTQDLGMIGNGSGRGFELHSGLAVRVESWTLEQRPEGQLLGLFDQRCRRPGPAPEGESRTARLKRPRKSNWWADAFRWVGSPPEGCQWIYLADREADFYEPIQTCQELGIDFVIRGYQDRRLADEAGKLRNALAGTPVLGQSTVPLRSRGGEPARTAIVQLRSVCVDLDGPWRPGGWKEPLRGVWVVEVQEVDVPEGVEPLHWILLTSLPCQSLAQARRVVGRYTARWWVEEYHKALKTGAGVEASQLERGGRLEPLIAVLAVVAVRLLNTKMLARSRPEGLEAKQSLGPEALALLENKFGRPKGGWNNCNILVATARLGGFLARKHDGMPGWQTIWRGWQRLMWMCEGLETLNAQGRTCG
jgi:Transposase DNA-binding/Transposase Tn5 dimerisation domain